MKEIVVLGAGYGGVLTAKKLAKRFKKDQDIRIRLIDRKPFHTMMTELHEVAAGRVDEDAIKMDLKKIFAGLKVEIVLDEITNVDFKSNKLQGKRDTYKYDHLVIGTGCKPSFFGIPGAEEHSFSLWSFEDAVKLKQQIRQMFMDATKLSDPDKRKQMLTFVVVGAGFTGVEMIGNWRNTESSCARNSMSMNPKFVSSWPIWHRRFCRFCRRILSTKRTSISAR